jgi:hypothetical protein
MTVFRKALRPGRSGAGRRRSALGLNRARELQRTGAAAPARAGLRAGSAANGTVCVSSAEDKGAVMTATSPDVVWVIVTVGGFTIHLLTVLRAITRPDRTLAWRVARVAVMMCLPVIGVVTAPAWIGITPFSGYWENRILAMRRIA